MGKTENLEIGAGESICVEIVGDGPPLLMVAGLGDDHTLFDPLVARLRDRFTCITYDHRGSGSSSPLPADADIATLAEDGHRLLAQLGLPAVLGLGCSMGGTVLQEWALRHPEDFSRLILMSTFARPRAYMRARMAHWRALHEAGQTERLIESIALLCLSPDCWDRDPDLAAELLAADELAPGFITQLHACLSHDTLARLGEVRHPCLVIHGSEDLLIPVAHGEELAEHLADSTLRILPTGHVPLWEEPEETAAAITAFCS
jgi:pimeloyl-ACP methyl ester carboxylesterase